ncbi:MAG TPA: hypothetical protein PKK61_00920 [Defluviitaleaceae bacterium]|nr:hypothetical protein [Defluviitaleaceae bacterium]
MGVILAVSGLISLIISDIALVSYVLAAIGLSAVAKKAGLENTWFAWIPLLNLYLMGKVIGKLNLFGQEINNMEIALPVVVVVGNIASSIISKIPAIGGLLGFIVSLAVIVFSAASCYEIYKMYKDTSNKLNVVLSIIFFPIFLFMIRNDEPIVSSNDNSLSM